MRRGIFPAPRRLRRSIDPALEAICLKAMSLKPEDRHATPIAMAEEIEAWLADVRYRAEHEQALGDVKRSLARLAIERAGRLFERGMIGEGMLWLARALENIPPDAPGLDRAVRASLGGWHAGPKAVERTLSHRDVVHAVAFSPDGRRLLTACADGTAQLWDVATGARLAVADEARGGRPRRRLQPGRAAGRDGGRRRGAPALGRRDRGVRRRRRPPRRADLRRVLQPRRPRVATASRAGTPCLWDGATGRPIGGPAPWPGEPGASILSMAFHPDGTRLAVAGDDGTVGFWDAAAGTPIGRAIRREAAALRPGVRPRRPDAPRRLPRRPGPALGCRRWVAPGGAGPRGRRRGRLRRVRPGRAHDRDGVPDGTARLWDVATGRPIGEPMAHRGPVDRLAFHPEGTIVATAGRDGTARLWDAGTGLAIGPPLEHRGAVHDLAFSPDGRRLATASADAMARCWRVPAPVAGDCRADRLLGPRRRPNANSTRATPSDRSTTGPLGTPPPPPGPGRAAGLKSRRAEEFHAETQRAAETQRRGSGLRAESGGPCGNTESVLCLLVTIALIGLAKISLLLCVSAALCVSA